MSGKRRIQWLALISFSVCLPLQGAAVRQLSDFQANVLGANDDSFTGPHNLGFTANLFGVSTTQVFVNNNGNITIGAGLADFTPNPIGGLNQLIVAPFWADVDTRLGNVVTFGTSTIGGNSAFGVWWNDVGYYAGHTDRLNDFQLVLISRTDTCPVGVPNCGNFDIEFNYDQIQWETGDFSGGTGGLGGTPARAGYSNSAGASFELPGSGISGAFLDGGSNALISGSFNSTVAGRYLFEVRNGSVGTPGATPQTPILPNGTNAAGQWLFVGIPTGLWSDPPNTYGFDYAGTGGTLFTQVGLPTGFLDPFSIFTGPTFSTLLGTFAGGTTVDFVSLAGSALSQFRITGINPTFDSTANPAG
ncbi:MAG: nidogen-like domain-containing protein, partial [Bryobacteraceae bacterium]|nr:nidogen-like domain-containing protein [Bryobacteraceae bacterium]